MATRQCSGWELQREELQVRIGLKHRKYFRGNYLLRAFSAGLIEITDPASRNSPQQRYWLTPFGKKLRTGQGNPETRL